MCTESIAQIIQIIGELEGSFIAQTDVDSALKTCVGLYMLICLKSYRIERLKYMKVCQIKGRRVGKPWWNENLSLVWNEVCLKKRLWVKCKDPRQKRILKLDYVQKRKEFDRHVQKAKR